MTHSDRDGSEPQVDLLGALQRSIDAARDYQRTQDATLKRFRPPQEATGATPAPLDMPRITHFLDVTDWRPTFICKAPAGSACNTGCAERCDAWGEGYGCDHDQAAPLGYCNVVTWLDEEDGQECAEDDHALLPLAIRWDGDRYRWRIVSAPAGLPLHEQADRDGDNVPSDDATDRSWAQFHNGVVQGYEADMALLGAERDAARVEVARWKKAWQGSDREWAKDQATIARVEAVLGEPAWSSAVPTPVLLAALRGSELTEDVPSHITVTPTAAGNVEAFCRTCRLGQIATPGAAAEAIVGFEHHRHEGGEST